MKAPLKSFSRFGKIRWLGYSSALLLALGLVTLFLMVEISSQPRFCGTCHVMQPYFESWETSSHRDVDCVDCHIPPGVAHEVRKKWEALSMVASYFTGTYGTNPWTEIDDSACLHCHERRLLSGQELFGDVLFNHSPHLTELRRGKKLRCTSCHSQIVQGRHIAVTTSTCILCHFKGENPGESTARCQLCHSVPDKIIERGMVRFDHADVKRFDMDCAWCHPHDVSGTDGQVPQERCFTCHNEPRRLAEYENVDLMHRTHVTEHKVDCLHCHLEIRHGKVERLQAAQTGCQRCHQGGHSPQRDLYAGIGGRGVTPMPAPMFLAGVACEGCHFPIPGHAEETAKASDVACMSCHGPRYRPAYFRWKEASRQRIQPLRRQLQSTVRLFPQSEPQALADARHNLELVEKGIGSHNIRYAFALLSAAHGFLNDARRQVKARPLPVPWPESPYESDCLQCHQGAEAQTGRAFGQPFKHSVHVVNQKLDCLQCHRTHEEKEPGEVLRFDSSGCQNCHHQEPRADCLDCHSDITDKAILSFRGEFLHSLHIEMDFGCSDCHQLRPGQPTLLDREVCTACHE